MFFDECLNLGTVQDHLHCQIPKENLELKMDLKIMQ